MNLYKLYHQMTLFHIIRRLLPLVANSTKTIYMLSGHIKFLSKFQYKKRFPPLQYIDKGLIDF